LTIKGRKVRELYNTLTLGAELRSNGFTNVEVIDFPDGFHIKTDRGTLIYEGLDSFIKNYNCMEDYNLKVVITIWEELNTNLDNQVETLLTKNKLEYSEEAYNSLINKVTTMEDFYLELSKEFPIQIGNDVFLLDNVELFKLTDWNMPYVYDRLVEYKVKQAYLEVYNFDWLTIFIKELEKTDLYKKLDIEVKSGNYQDALRLYKYICSYFEKSKEIQ
jgi:hypothetical protein